MVWFVWMVKSVMIVKMVGIAMVFRIGRIHSFVLRHSRWLIKGKKVRWWEGVYGQNTLYLPTFLASQLLSFTHLLTFTTSPLRSFHLLSCHLSALSLFSPPYANSPPIRRRTGPSSHLPTFLASIFWPPTSNSRRLTLQQPKASHLPTFLPSHLLSFNL